MFKNEYIFYQIVQKTGILIITVLAVLTISIAVSPLAIAAPNENARNPEIETITFIDKFKPIHEMPDVNTSLSCEDTSNKFAKISGGIKWKAFPVPYSINAPYPAWADAVRAGFATWDAEDHGFDPDDTEKRFFVEDGTAPKITVSWAPIDGVGGTLGVASFSYYPSLKEIISVRIIFDSDDNWTTSSGVSCTEGATNTFDVGDVATHEIGHAIGFDHVKSPNSIYNTMYKFVILDGETHKKTLGDGERIGIESLYGTSIDEPVDEGPDCSKSKSKKWC